MSMSFATALRGRLLRMSPEAREAELAKTPIPKRADYKRDVVAHGLDSAYVADSAKQHEKLLDSKYVLRLELLGLDKMWARRAGVAAWWEPVRNRPSTGQAIFERMTDADAAPFKNLDPDPWSKVRDLLQAA